MGDKTYFVYIVASASRVLDAGVTSNLMARVWQHKQGTVAGFSRKYRTKELMWFETFGEIRDAIECEKRIKGWRRSKKIALIQKMNPHWKDLSAEWYPGATLIV